MREAPALILIDLLTKAGCKVKAFDPVSVDECKRRIGDKVEYVENHYDALNGADVLFLVTEWTEFRFPDWAKMKNLLKTPVIFDGRNIYDKNELSQEGFDYMLLNRWDILITTLGEFGALDYNKLLPIPQREIDSNPNIKQNPGY